MGLRAGSQERMTFELRSEERRGTAHMEQGWGQRKHSRQREQKGEEEGGGQHGRGWKRRPGEEFGFYSK